MKRTVYLAGPILGCDNMEANDWRRYVADKLAEHNIIGISPLRCEPLIGDRYTTNYPDPKFGTARAIGSKNFFDLQTCDLTLAYLPIPLPGRQQSFGTVCELAWAHALQKPSILVSNDPFIRDHPVLNTCAGWLLNDLDEAVDVCIGLLAGYVGGKNV